MNTKSQVRNILHKHGLKATGPRLKIYNLLFNSLSHPNMVDLKRMIRERKLTIPTATLYNTIEAFSEVGLIWLFSTCIGGCMYIDTNPDKHGHFTCLHCGSIRDIPYPEELYENHRHVTIDHIILHMTGRCERCKL